MYLERQPVRKLVVISTRRLSARRRKSNSNVWLEERKLSPPTVMTYGPKQARRRPRVWKIYIVYWNIYRVTFSGSVCPDFFVICHEILFNLYCVLKYLPSNIQGFYLPRFFLFVVTAEWRPKFAVSYCIRYNFCFKHIQRKHYSAHSVVWISMSSFVHVRNSHTFEYQHLCTQQDVHFSLRRMLSCARRPKPCLAQLIQFLPTLTGHLSPTWLPTLTDHLSPTWLHGPSGTIVICWHLGPFMIFIALLELSSCLLLLLLIVTWMTVTRHHACFNHPASTYFAWLSALLRLHFSLKCPPLPTLPGHSHIPSLCPLYFFWCSRFAGHNHNFCCFCDHLFGVILTALMGWGRHADWSKKCFVLCEVSANWEHGKWKPTYFTVFSHCLEVLNGTIYWHWQRNSSKKQVKSRFKTEDN